MLRIAVLVLVLLSACSNAPSPVASRVRATPAPTPEPSIVIETPLSATSPPKPAARPAPKPRAVPKTDVLIAFRKLGSWSDVYDHTDDPATIVPLVRTMAAHGVRTLYLETGRYASPTDIQFPRAAGAALDQAKALGMRTVAWYAPDFSDVALDVRRSLAAIAFRSPNGNRFDAFGADIEYSRIKDFSERNRRVVDYCRQLRARAGAFPLAAIVFPPTALERKPDTWPDYPWAEFGRDFDIVMPMNYWTFHTKDARETASLTMRNARTVRRLTGRPTHVIGGLATDADSAQTAAYVTAALESGSIGGSLYDGRTTTADQWASLAAFNR
jgi:hypothetical protein